MADAEEFRTVCVEDAGTTGLLDLGAAGLGELAAACHRLAAWATWGESLAAACLTSCGELSAHPGQWGPCGQVSPVVGFEERRFNTTCLLSVRLGVSRARAGQIVDHGSALMSIGFSPTEVLERCGVLDSAKAFLVTRRLEDVSVPVALEVQEKVLLQAPRQSVSQVGRDIERALMEVDPGGHAERARANQERRCVSRPRSAGEGVSLVRLLLPTMDALLLDATLDAIAASARACGEQRSLGQLRADAVTAMTVSTLRTSQMVAFNWSAQGVSGDRAEGQTGGDRPQARASLPVISPSSRVSQDDSDTDVTAGAGPGGLLPDGVPLEGLLGVLSGLVGSTSEWWTPSGTRDLSLPAAGIHVDVQVTVPITSLTGPAGPPGLTSPGEFTGRGPGSSPGVGPGYSEWSQDLAEEPGGAAHTDDPDSTGASPPGAGGRSLPSSGGRSLPAPGQGAPGVQPAAATETAEVRIGARSVVVPAMTAWALAAGGTWRRLVTDPTSGTALDVGRTRYRPPAGLADLVRARDRSCVFPACQVPADRCDIDHLIAWGQGGTTSLDNLVTLCKAHHRLKHTPGWALARDRVSGVLSWHTPDRTVYQRHPDGTINRLPRKVGPRQRYVPGGVVPASLSRQITPEIIDRLNRALDRAQPTSGGVRLVTRGPRPGERAGDYETVPYPRATHTLGLAPLIDHAPPF